MKKILTLILFFLSQVSFAQFNLVPNPSFEIFDTCPNNLGQIRFAIPWMNPNFTTPDYLHVCTSNPWVSVPVNYAGNEPAHTGSAYALIVTYTNYQPPFQQFNNYREYLETELTDSLITGVNYCIRFYVSACDSSKYISNDIGVYFSPLQIQDSSTVLPYIPQFENPSNNNLNSRNGWTLISGTYTAGGGEKFVVLGNFKDSSATMAIPSGWTLNPGYVWATYYIDDVLITPCDSLTNFNENKFSTNGFKIYPSPANKEINIFTDNYLIEEYTIYNAFGLVINSVKNLNKKLNKISLNVTSYKNGIYGIKVITNKNIYNLKFIKN